MGFRCKALFDHAFLISHEFFGVRCVIEDFDLFDEHLESHLFGNGLYCNREGIKQPANSLDPRNPKPRGSPFWRPPGFSRKREEEDPFAVVMSFDRVPEQFSPDPVVNCNSGLQF